MPKVFIRNNGQPHLPQDQRRPFHLLRRAIPVGGRLEVTDDVLRALGKLPGFDAAKEFAESLATRVNANLPGERLTAIVEPEEKQKRPEKPPKETTLSDTTPGENGEGETS